MCRVHNHDILLCVLGNTLMQEIDVRACVRACVCVCVCVCVCWGGGGVGYQIWLQLLQLLLERTQLHSNVGSLPHSK